MKIAEKKLRKILKRYDSLAIACSGGTDSTLLAKFASEVLEGSILLIHVRSYMSPERESSFIEKWAMENNLNLKILKLKPLSVPNIKRNSRRRCYYCKLLIMKAVIHEACQNGIDKVADGTNLDDFGDYRPGLKATEKLGILHPLAEAGFDKKRVRLFARRYNLPNWKTPSSACLASRIPYGTALSPEIMKRVEKAEEYLCDKYKFYGCRVRVFDKVDCCSIELNPLYLHRFIKNRGCIINEFKDIGFSRVLIDAQGYRRGSLNS